MATYKLKRKTFAFAMTKQAFQGAKNAFKAGNIGTGFKETGKMLGRGAIGVGKVAVPTAIGAAAIGAGAVANELDKPNR